MSQLVLHIDFPNEKIDEIKQEIREQVSDEMYYKGYSDAVQVMKISNKKLIPYFDREKGVSKCSNCDGLVYVHYKFCPFCSRGLDWENYMGSPKGEVNE